MPTYKEEICICRTIDEIKNCVPDCQIVIADSNSPDRTRDLALSRGCLINNTLERGKGRAVREVLASIDSPYFIMMDSDFTYPAEYIPQVMERLTDGADVVMAYRDAVFSKAMTKTNRFGNSVLSLIASVLYGYRVKDVCTGMWGFKGDALKKFALISNHFTLEADLFINAVRNRCKIEQMPIHYRPRLDNSETKLKVRDGLKIGWFLVKRRFG